MKDLEKLKKIVAEIKDLCADRMDAISAEGRELSKVFEEAEELLGKLKDK